MQALATQWAGGIRGLGLTVAGRALVLVPVPEANIECMRCCREVLLGESKTTFRLPLTQGSVTFNDGREEPSRWWDLREGDEGWRDSAWLWAKHDGTQQANNLLTVHLESINRIDRTENGNGKNRIVVSNLRSMRAFSACPKPNEVEVGG